MMNDTAIRVNYPTVVSIRYQEDDSVIATDDNEEVVEIDEALVNAWVDPNAYQELRKNEYNKLNQDEMRFDDLINGTTTWVDSIKAIKDKYPKE
tara:strand:- start:306 stop:587 length:282 start_codon:yes stop_codon:yes gene_type:complete